MAQFGDFLGVFPSDESNNAAPNGNNVNANTTGRRRQIIPFDCLKNCGNPEQKIAWNAAMYTIEYLVDWAASNPITVVSLQDTKSFLAEMNNINKDYYFECTNMAMFHDSVTGSLLPKFVYGRLPTILKEYKNEIQAARATSWYNSRLGSYHVSHDFIRTNICNIDHTTACIGLQDNSKTHIDATLESSELGSATCGKRRRPLALGLKNPKPTTIQRWNPRKKRNV